MREKKYNGIISDEPPYEVVLQNYSVQFIFEFFSVLLFFDKQWNKSISSHNKRIPKTHSGSSHEN